MCEYEMYVKRNNNNNTIDLVQVMDVRKMEYHVATFNVVIDKGTLDCLMVQFDNSSNHLNSAEKALQQTPSLC